MELAVARAREAIDTLYEADDLAETAIVQIDDVQYWAENNDQIPAADLAKGLCVVNRVKEKVGRARAELAEAVREVEALIEGRM